MKRLLKKHFLSIFLLGALYSQPAAANTTMNVLLDGHSLKVTTAEVVYSVTFTGDGRYTTDDGRSGAWTLDGESLCVERDNGPSSCGVLPDGKSVGDSWTTTTVTGEPATASIME